MVSKGLAKATEWRPVGGAGRVGGTELVGEGGGCVGRWGLAGRRMLVVGGVGEVGGAIGLMSAIGLIGGQQSPSQSAGWRRVGRGTALVGEGGGCVGRWAGWWAGRLAGWQVLGEDSRGVGW